MVSHHIIKNLKKIIFFTFLFFEIHINAQSTLLSYGALQNDNGVKGYYFIQAEDKSKKERELTVELFDNDLKLTGKVTFVEDALFDTKQSNIMKIPQFEENISCNGNTLFIMLYKVLDNGNYFKRIVLIDIKDSKVISEYEVPAEEINDDFSMLKGKKVIRYSKDIATGYDHFFRKAWIIQKVSKLDLFDIDENYFFSRSKGNLSFCKKNDGQVVFVVKYDQLKDNVKYEPNASYKTPGKNEYLIVGNVFVEQNSDSQKESINFGYFFDIIDSVGNFKKRKVVRNEVFNKYKIINQEGKLGRLGWRNILEYSDDNFGSIVFWDAGTSFYPPDFQPKHKQFSIPMPELAEKTFGNTIASCALIFEMDKNLEPFYGSFVFPSGNIVLNDKERYDAFVDAYYVKDKSAINIIALAGKKKKLGFERTKLVSIVYEKNKPLNIKEYDVNESADLTDFLPGKPGYMLVLEYFKKSKTITKRLEKLNY